MILKIYDFKSVVELQDKFNECFPDYWIEFYPSVSAMKGGAAAAPTCLVQNLTKKHHNGELQIQSSDSVERICARFKMEFGMHVRIFRCTANSFVQANGHEHLSKSL